MQYVRATENKPPPAAAQQMCAEVELQTLDWTALLFDKRERTLWIVAVTDTD